MDRKKTALTQDIKNEKQNYIQSFLEGVIGIGGWQIEAKPFFRVDMVFTNLTSEKKKNLLSLKLVL